MKSYEDADKWTKLHDHNGDEREGVSSVSSVARMKLFHYKYPFTGNMLRLRLTGIRHQESIQTTYRGQADTHIQTSERGALKVGQCKNHFLPGQTSRWTD